MSSYKEIVGQKITKVSSDPGEPKTGQMWYNSTTGSLRGLGILEAWSSASPVARASQGGYYGAIGTSTSGLALVGTPGNSSPLETEEWNGTGWSASDNMAPYSGINGNMTPSGGAAGTVTSALYAGGEMYTGNTRAKAQEYDGSSWTSITDMPQNTGYDVGIGTASNTSIMVGGYDETYAFLNATVDWSGSSWTAGGTLGTARWAASGGGTETAAWFSGGKTGSYPGTTTTATENYNGSSWSTGDALNTARWFSGGVGPQTAAMVIGERPSPGPGRGGNTEVYNGTAWTETADLATARVQFKGNAGTSAGAFVAGGSVPPSSSATEEFNKSTNIITAAAWTSGGTYPYAAANLVSLGPATAMLSCGGNNSGPTNQTTVTLYDGTSYSAETAMPSAGNGMGSGKGGTETAGLVFGGDFADDPATATKTILYNGSSWTSGGALSTGRRNLGGLGISTAALAFGGQTPSYTTATEEYGGSSWTSGGALPAARRNATGVGSQTAGLVLAGQSPPGAGVNTSFTYNGTSYSGGPTMINSRSDGASSGPNSSNTSALVYGGSAGAPPYTVLLPTETYDGSAFSTAPSLSTGRDGQGSGGSSTEGVQVAGYVPSGSYLSSTEQFTPESTAANIANFTTS